MISESQKKASAKYKKQKCKIVNILFKNEDYAVLKTAADLAGETVCGYIKRAIELRRGIEDGREIGLPIENNASL